MNTIIFIFFLFPSLFVFRTLIRFYVLFSIQRAMKNIAYIIFKLSIKQIKKAYVGTIDAPVIVSEHSTLPEMPLTEKRNFNRIVLFGAKV